MTSKKRRSPQRPPTRISADKREAVIRLLREGKSLRFIQFTVGCAPRTANYIRRKEGIVRPLCPCGRPGGHRGVCSAMRAADQPHAPTRPARPATTRLGKIIDTEIRRKRWLPTELAVRARMTGLRMTQIRLGAKFSVIVMPRDVDRLADALGVPDGTRITMHYAAAADLGYRLPELAPRPAAFSMIGRALKSKEQPVWRRLDLNL